jgi:hypothetical protein
MRSSPRLSRANDVNYDLHADLWDAWTAIVWMGGGWAGEVPRKLLYVQYKYNPSAVRLPLVGRILVSTSPVSSLI